MKHTGDNENTLVARSPRTYSRAKVNSFKIHFNKVYVSQQVWVAEIKFLLLNSQNWFDELSVTIIKRLFFLTGDIHFF